ncbi:FG-GAP-like repeat-containing protein [Akkermansiaceae bacterium]|nr:FG-GAP-like repeat-containing protein [Akkermansiaceae bacterium]
MACDKKDVQSEEEIITSEKVVREEVLTERLPTAGDETLFAKISPQVSGVDFKNLLKEDHALVRLYYSGFGCGGVVMGDFDGDGTRDLFFTGGAGKNGLFLQRKGRLKFENATEESGVSGGEAWSAGALAVDLEGDGDLDLVVTNYDDPPHIFINDGSGKFVERGRDCGFMQADAMLMPTVCDYDRDGDLDLFFVTNQLYLEGGRPATPPFVKDATGQIQVKPGYEKYFGLKPNGAGGFKMDTIGRPDYLFRNDGGAFPKFTDVSSAAGLSAPGFGLSATWFDFDADGWPDLHVGNDFSDPDRLYRNMGDGTFKDVARAAFPHCAWFSMGADAADVDGDGLDDLFCADMAFTTHYKQKVGMGQMGSQKNLLLSISPLQVMRNHLFLNTGLGPFREAGQLAGIAKSDWSWGVKFADLDLDGREDLFVANGSIRSFNHADYGTDDNLPVGLQSLAETLVKEYDSTLVQREACKIVLNLGLEEAKFSLEERQDHEQAFTLLRPVLERTVRQIKRTVEYYQSNFDSEPIETIFLGGEIAARGKLFGFIAQQLSSKVIAIDPFDSQELHAKSPPPVDKADRIAFGPAFGLAIEGTREGINFAHTYKERQEEGKHNKLAITISALLIALLVAATIFYNSQRLDLLKLEAEQDKLEENLKDLGPKLTEAIITEASEEVLSLEERRRAATNRYESIALVSEITRLIPQNVSLLHVSAAMGSTISFLDPSAETKKKSPVNSAADRKGTLLLKGVVTGERTSLETSLTIYIARLDQSRLFHKVKVDSTELVSSSGKLHLTFTLSVETIDESSDITTN